MDRHPRRVLNILKQFCDKMWKCERKKAAFEKETKDVQSRVLSTTISMISNLLNFIDTNRYLI